MGLTALQATAKDSARLKSASIAARRPQLALAIRKRNSRRCGPDCGVYDLGFRAKISLTGGDRVRWLNGMVTNNIRDLAEGHGVYAFLLNPQGHILGDLYAYNRGESIIVDTDRDQMEKILATFDHYIIMDDVEVKNLSEEITRLGSAGPKSREVLKTAGFADWRDASCCRCRNIAWQGIDCTVIRGEDEIHPSYEIWVAPGGRPKSFGRRC